jgi:16S rRNA (uracil1498-N3)-methyltransferase
MHRFYCPTKNIFKDKIIINDLKGVHHIKDVLRLKEKDRLSVFDDSGSEYDGYIKEMSPEAIVIAIKEKFPSKKETIVITLACALPKKSKFDDIVDKLTQLGVSKIIPLRTKRVIIKLDRHKACLRQLRWQKIAQNASQQCQRSHLPIIEPVKELGEVLSQAEDFDLKLIPTLIGERQELKEIIVARKAKNILVLIGPEGDFTPQEVDLAKQAGCIPISLGDLVLRVETAAVAVASFIKFYAKR